MAGLAPVELVLVLLFVAVQGIRIAGGSLDGRIVWALPPLGLAGLAAGLGFAAAAARDRATARQFLNDQARAVVPIYLLAILLAAGVLGPMLTNGSPERYVSDPETASYLLNLIAWPHFFLPGVFEFNDLPGIVNGVVGLVPFVVLVIVLLSLSPAGMVGRWLPLVAAVAVALAAVLAQALDLDLGGATDPGFLALQGDGLGVLLGGTLGVALFRLRDRVPFGSLVAGASALLLLAIAGAGHAEWADTATLRVVAAVPAGYLGVYGAIRPWPLGRLARRLARYLPGVVLLSFPVQQVAAQLLPRVGSGGIIGAGLVGAGLIAAVVWHGLTRRLLSERQRISTTVEEVALALPRWDRPKLRFGMDTLGYLALAALFVAAVLGVTAMMYIAMLPETGGI